MISTIKDGIHVVGIDDAPHQRGDSTTEVFFTYCKSTFLENVTHASISVDGTDATAVILNELQKKQESINLILLHGVTVGGLNIVNIKELSETLQKPILAVTENPPSGASIYDAVEHLSDSKLRKKWLDDAGSLYTYPTEHGSTPLTYHRIGIEENVAKQFFSKFCIRSRLPEQLLLAHKIATAWK